MKLNYYDPADEPDFIEIREGPVSHFFTVLSGSEVRFSGFGGEKPLHEPHLPEKIKSVFTENGITVY